MAAGAAAAFLVGTILLRLFPVREMDDVDDDDASLGDAMEGVPSGVTGTGVAFVPQ